MNTEVSETTQKIVDFSMGGGVADGQCLFSFDSKYLSFEYLNNEKKQAQNFG